MYRHFLVFHFIRKFQQVSLWIMSSAGSVTFYSVQWKIFCLNFFVTRSIVLDPRSAVWDLDGDTWNNTTILYFFNIEPSFVVTLLFLCKFLTTASSRRTFALTSKLNPQNWMLRNQSYRLWSHGLSSVQGHNESTGLQCPLAFACWRQTLVSSVDSAWEALMERELRRGTRPL